MATDPDSVMVVLEHPHGHMEVPLRTWMEYRPDQRVGLAPERAYDSATGKRLPLSVIPLAYRNSPLSRRLIALKLLRDPWRPAAPQERRIPRWMKMLGLLALVVIGAGGLFLWLGGGLQDLLRYPPATTLFYEETAQQATLIAETRDSPGAVADHYRSRLAASAGWNLILDEGTRLVFERSAIAQGGGPLPAISSETIEITLKYASPVTRIEVLYGRSASGGN